MGQLWDKFRRQAAAEGERMYAAEQKRTLPLMRTEERERLQARGFEYVSGTAWPHLLAHVLPRGYVYQSPLGELWFRCPVPGITVRELLAYLVTLDKRCRHAPRDVQREARGFDMERARNLAYSLVRATDLDSWQGIIEAELALAALEG